MDQREKVDVNWRQIVIDIASVIYDGLLIMLLTVGAIMALYLAIRQEIQEPGGE